MRKTLKGFGLALLVMVLVAAGGGVGQFLSTSGGTISGCTVGKGIASNGLAPCSGTKRGNFVATDDTAITNYGLWIDRTGSVSRGICLAGSTAGSCLNSVLVDGTTAATFSSSLGSNSDVFSQFYFRSIGTTQAPIQAQVLSGGGLEYDTTNSRLRAYEGANWNFVVTENADAGTPLIAPIPAPATQVEAVSNTAIGFAAASDRGPRGTLIQWGNGRRFVQLGGAVNWALEQRTLALNPGHESTLLTCDACTRSAASTFDGLTVTDAAAGGTTVIDVVDFRTFVTAASAASVSSVISRVPETRRNQFPHMVFTGMMTATTSERVWYGLSAIALNAADAPVGNFAAFRYSTNASDTKWQFCTGDGTTTTCSDTGVTVAANRLYALEVDCRDVAAGKCIATIQAQGTGVPVTIQKTTNLPLAATNMSIRHYCEALAASARTCGVGPSMLETL